MRDLAHRVGQRGHLPQPAGHAVDPGRGQPQAVDHRGTHASGPLTLDVGGVGSDQVVRPLDEQVGGGKQGGVLGGNEAVANSRLARALSGGAPNRKSLTRTHAKVQGCGDGGVQRGSARRPTPWYGPMRRRRKDTP